MTAPDPTTEPAETDAVDTEATTTDVDTDPADDTDGQDPAAKARREAKSLRDRLRTTESERDTMSSQLAALRIAEVHRLAGEHLARGADLTEVGQVVVSDLLDENGIVSAALVAEAAERLTEDRRYLSRKRFQGSADGGAKGGPVGTSPTWSDALKASRRG